MKEEMLEKREERRKEREKHEEKGKIEISDYFGQCKLKSFNIILTKEGEIL